MRKRSVRGRNEEEDVRMHKCKLPNCGFESPNNYGLNQHIRQIHLSVEEIEEDTFADPIGQGSDPDYQVLSIDNIESPSLDSTESDKIGIDDDQNSEICEIDCEAPPEDQCDPISIESTSMDTDPIYQPFDISMISPEDLKYFELSKIALNNGFSGNTLTDMLKFLKGCSISNLKNNANTHWAGFERLCKKYGFKEEPHFLQKKISLLDLNMRETVTVTYVNPRKAVIRLLKGTDFSCFDLRADTSSFRNEEYREFFSGKWAHFAENNVRTEYKNLENVHLLGLIIMTDSSTINLSKSKKPFYIAFANAHYRYRNNINCMECVGKLSYSYLTIFRLYS